MQSLDEQLFYLINHAWQADWLDVILVSWREKTNWIPLYILVAIAIIWKFRKQSVVYLLAIIITAGIADFTSSKIVKPSVKRLRPCKNEQLSDTLILRVSCGSGYSFTSSHATNHFAFAVLLMLLFGHYMKRWKYLWLLWASIVAYAQVYVGVHYPTDVLAGAVLGAFIAYVMYRIFRYVYPPPAPLATKTA